MSNPSTRASATEAAHSHLVKSPRILIIESEESIQQAIKDTLSKAGYKDIATVSTPEKADQKIAEGGAYDVYVLSNNTEAGENWIMQKCPFSQESKTDSSFYVLIMKEGKKSMILTPADLALNEKHLEDLPSAIREFFDARQVGAARL